MIAIALALPIGIWLPDVLGGGSNLIAMAEHARVGLGMLCVLFVAKVLFTSTSFGSGAPGGIFMPIPAVGSLCRRYLRRDVAPVRQPAVRFRGDFLGMRDDGHAGRVRENTDHVDSAGLEMSGTLTHMLPVAAVAFIALLVSDLLRTKPIYGELLERYMRAQGGTTAIANRIDNGIMELPVEMGATADGKLMRDVRWPYGCLVIGLRRGERQIVPHGDTLAARRRLSGRVVQRRGRKRRTACDAAGCATYPSDAALPSSITIRRRQGHPKLSTVIHRIGHVRCLVATHV